MDDYGYGDMVEQKSHSIVSVVVALASIANIDQDERVDAILENCGGEDDFDRSPSPR